MHTFPPQKPVQLHKMKTIYLLLSLLSTSAVFAQLDTISYTNLTKGRYSITYPQSWRLDTSKTFGMDLLLLSPKTDSLDHFIENINVFVQDLHGQGYDLSRMGRESEGQIKNFVNEVVVTDSKLDSTVSQLFYKLYYTGRQGKFKLITMQRYFLKDEIGYAITMTIKSGKEGEYMTIAEKIFNSFNIQ
jgi:hypothetical protein